MEPYQNGEMELVFVIFCIILCTLTSQVQPTATRTKLAYCIDSRRLRLCLKVVGGFYFCTPRSYTVMGAADSITGKYNKKPRSNKRRFTFNFSKRLLLNKPSHPKRICQILEFTTTTTNFHNLDNYCSNIIVNLTPYLSTVCQHSLYRRQPNRPSFIYTMLTFSLPRVA